MRLMSIALVLAVIAGLGWAWLFGSAYMTRWKMEDVVGSAALSWTALGENRGRAQLDEEMRRRRIPPYLTPEQCTFYEDPGEIKVVDCSWTVDVYIPFTENARRLRFRVAKASTPHGVLEDR